MSERLLRATIREIKVEYNGADAVGTKQSRRKSASRNVVVAVLAYPRSGTAVVTSLKELDLPSGEVFSDFGKRPSFWDNGLFKEVVQGETALKISVSDRNRHNPIVRFLDRSMGGGLGVLFRGRTGGMLGGLVGNLTKALSDSIADSEQKVRNLTVATTDRAQIVIDESGELSVHNAGKSEDAPVHFEDGRLRLAFRAPRRFTHTVLDRTRGARAPKATEVSLLEEGDLNGYVVLDLALVPRVS
ncbi:MAG: hypothetical protein R2991_08385 [Thermoanaerobaculia bacterium]